MSASGIGAKVKSSAEIHDHIIQLDGEGDSESEEEVQVEQSKKDSGVEYFESEDELREEMRNETCSVEAYIGNLKSEKGFWTLTDGNLVLLEEEGSVLKDVKAENLVYLRMVCKEVGDV